MHEVKGGHLNHEHCTGLQEAEHAGKGVSQNGRACLQERRARHLESLAKEPNFEVKHAFLQVGVDDPNLKYLKYRVKVKTISLAHTHILCHGVLLRSEIKHCIPGRSRWINNLYVLEC